MRRLPWDSEPDVSVVRAHWRTEFPALAVARVGLEETLMQLAAWGIRLGVITNGSVLTQSAKIEHLRIAKYFSSVVISEAVECEKPDARIFRRALGEIGCEAARTWFVGDHPADPEPERRIRALPELLDLVSRER